MGRNGPTTAVQLAGVHVVDLGIWRPAPYAAQLLAELGAAVTKVEPPGGDPMRAFPALYQVLNGAKEVVELDLKTEVGRSALAPLLAGADVVVEGFRPGVAARLGAGPDDVAALNPSAVYCSISGFGQAGPLAAASGHDVNYQAWAGMLASTSAGAPSPDVPVADLAGGAFAAMSICAALARRGIVGRDRYEGARIDVSMADVLASWAGPGAEAASTRTEHRFPAYGTFACEDGLVTLGIVSEDPFWRALCGEVGLGDHVAALDAEGRAADGPALRAPLAERIVQHRRDDLVAALLAAGVPVAPVLTRTEALAVDHFAARGTVAGDDFGHPVRFG